MKCENDMIDSGDDDVYHVNRDNDYEWFSS